MSRFNIFVSVVLVSRTCFKVNISKAIIERDNVIQSMLSVMTLFVGNISKQSCLFYSIIANVPFIHNLELTNPYTTNIISSVLRCVLRIFIKYYICAGFL